MRCGPAAAGDRRKLVHVAGKAAVANIEVGADVDIAPCIAGNSYRMQRPGAGSDPGSRKRQCGEHAVCAHFVDGSPSVVYSSANHKRIETVGRNKNIAVTLRNRNGIGQRRGAGAGVRRARKHSGEDAGYAIVRLPHHTVVRVGGIDVPRAVDRHAGRLHKIRAAHAAVVE